MAKNVRWQDEYWLLLMQLYLKKPEGVKPLYERTRFIEKYLDTDFHVIAGGLQVYDRNRSLGNNLRFLYEKRYLYKHGISYRQQNPYKEFHTVNFLVERDIMLRIPFDEEFKDYGYEDVLFGKQLKEAGITIHHMANPVMMIHFDENPVTVSFTDKTAGMEKQFIRIGNILDVKQFDMRIPFGIELLIHILQHIFNTYLLTVTDTPDRIESQTFGYC